MKNTPKWRRNSKTALQTGRACPFQGRDLKDPLKTLQTRRKRFKTALQTGRACPLGYGPQKSLNKTLQTRRKRAKTALQTGKACPFWGWNLKGPIINTPNKEEKI